MKIKILHFFVILFFTQSVLCQKWLWKIAPFEMNITDLNVLLNSKPENYSDTELKYTLKEGNLFIVYSSKKCSSTSWGKWNVIDGTILGITFYPEKKRKTDYYKLKTPEMIKSLDDIGTEVYTNKEKGLLYTVYSGKVNEITFYPSQRFEKFRCIN